MSTTSFSSSSFSLEKGEEEGTCERGKKEIGYSLNQQWLSKQKFGTRALDGRDWPSKPDQIFWKKLFLLPLSYFYFFFFVTFSFCS